ncbi:MAG: SUMF1/EgtB/PvdO family nonheme iron enzyme [Nitrospiria bacterium]
MQEIFPEVPSILANRVHLAPLTREQALKAVTEPAGLGLSDFHTPSFHYKEEVLDALLDFLSGQAGQIEPFQLQVLCSHVELEVEKRREKKPEKEKEEKEETIEVDASYLGGNKGMDRILGDFYRTAIRTLPSRKSRRRARNLCEFGLLTQEGYRDSLGLRRILENYKLTQQELDQLVTARLLRKEPEYDSFKYELTHDSLRKPVMQSRPFKIPRGLLYGGGLLVAGLIVAAVFQRMQAVEQQRHAREIEEIKKTTQAAAQNLVQEKQALVGELSEARRRAKETIEALQENLEAQKIATKEAVAETERMIAELEAKRAQTTAEAQELAKLKTELTKQRRISKNVEQRVAQQQSKLAVTKREVEKKQSAFPIPEMVEIPAGKFQMGDLQGKGYKREEPVHPVHIQRPFLMGKYEVTFEEYDAFALATKRDLPRDRGWGRGRRPVIRVSWNDVKKYIAWLNQKTGLGFRLPTEAEWEYEARAGTTTVYWWGNQVGQNNANCRDCGSPWDGLKTAPVDAFKPNAFGLYNMSGNVWEWVEDCWHADYDNAPEDGSAWGKENGGDCGLRVLRGGSWGGRPSNLRSAVRSWSDADSRFYNDGFRLARTLK